MLHHVSFGVANLERAAAFYDATLAALGYIRVFANETAIGYGLIAGQDQFCIKLRPGVAAPGAGFHLAFAAPSRQAVADFHAAALQHGGQDDGGPGLRPHYGPDYYAAFVIDPDGHHVEVVINSPRRAG
ncbi:VOC family protein [Andreprevotia chitinilytica]|uniref:VOC family protein n=1 Tax=Andreprevotia chitinilytica TaxID=396808 RepID=UPI0005523104|nr:VOC family protein [Andreprevotia chitinilytica]